MNSAIPGPRSIAMGQRLARCENPGITFLSDEFPVFWERALGANVWDADGNRFVDLTAARGCFIGSLQSGVGSGSERPVARLFHGMGDVHPPVAKLDFWRHSRRDYLGSGRGILGQNGADAVEAALKAAYLHTKRPEILVFRVGITV